MPTQIARENRRFVFGHVRAGVGSRHFEDAISCLQGAGLFSKVTRFTEPALPDLSYRSPNVSMIFTHDVGVLGASWRRDSRNEAQTVEVHNPDDEVRSIVRKALAGGRCEPRIKLLLIFAP